MTSATLSHTLERSIVIRAQREVVFRFFTDSARWAAWWGAGSTIDPRPGGRVFIRYPGGIEVSGEIVEIDEPERIVFTYGFVAGSPIPPGSSLVTIALERERAGTRVRLSHAFAEAQVRDEHVQGWRYQLSLFANAVADDAGGVGAGDCRSLVRGLVRARCGCEKRRTGTHGGGGRLDARSLQRD